MGRPSEFTPELANAICEMLIEGFSLRSICKVEGLPSASTVCRWLGQNEEFREQYAHAREAQADTLTDQIVDIADGGLGVNVEGIGVVTTDPARDRLRVDARKWVASKLAPKKYGDAVQMKHTDGDGGPVQQVIRWANSDSEATPDPSNR